MKKNKYLKIIGMLFFPALFLLVSTGCDNDEPASKIGIYAGIWTLTTEASVGDPLGSGPLKIRLIGVNAEGDIYYGGAELTVSEGGPADVYWNVYAGFKNTFFFLIISEEEITREFIQAGNYILLAPASDQISENQMSGNYMKVPVGEYWELLGTFTMTRQ